MRVISIQTVGIFYGTLCILAYIHAYVNYNNISVNTASEALPQVA
jgi:hypothetical protein